MTIHIDDHGLTSDQEARVYSVHAFKGGETIGMLYETDHEVSGYGYSRYGKQFRVEDCESLEEAKLKFKIEYAFA